MAESNGKQVLGKCNRSIKFSSNDTQNDREFEVLKRHIFEEFKDKMYMQNPHIAPGYWVRLERGIAKILPLGCVFSITDFTNPHAPMPG